MAIKFDLPCRVCERRVLYATWPIGRKWFENTQTQLPGTISLDNFAAIMRWATEGMTLPYHRYLQNCFSQADKHAQGNDIITESIRLLRTSEHRLQTQFGVSENCTALVRDAKCVHCI